MDYLRKKYAGYKMIDRRFLQDELLLSDKEYADIRRDVAHTLNKGRCPFQLDLDTFCNIIECYLQ